MKRALAIVGFLLSSVAASSAADMVVKAPIAPAPVSNWTAFYVGGFAGGAWVNGSYCTYGPCASLDPDGFVGGVYAGFDYELANRFVVGGRISVPFGALDKSVAGGPVFANGDTIKAQMQWATLINLIFGYDMGVWMPYVGAGVAFANNKATLTVPGGASDSDTELHVGLNVLAGIKYAWTKHWAIGVQYNHTHFDKQTYHFGAFSTIAYGKFTTDSLVATLDYRF